MFVNFFQPSFKLADKRRAGAKVLKRYHAPATPYQRLLDDPRTPDETRVRLKAMYADLDPVLLLQNIREAQRHLAALADGLPDVIEKKQTDPDLAGFLESLKTIWMQGDVRPTSAEKPKQKRQRR